MDRIKGLPDDLLVQILSFVPTKTAVSTCILSRRWQFLWMWLPKLEYSRCDGLQEFITKNLPLHRAPVIERLRLHFVCETEYMKRWIEIAISRHVRELEISNGWKSSSKIFPSSFYTCKSLVNLKLNKITLKNVPSMVFLPSLKTLDLERVLIGYMDETALQSLLSICPVLEELSVILCREEHIREFTILVPSLQSLSLCLSVCYYLGGYEIDTPSLKYLKLKDWNYKEHYLVVKNMRHLREADISVVLLNIKSLIGSITSVKHLTICTSQYEYGDDFVFNQLEHLKLCPCKKGFWNLFGRLLKSSPNVRVLDLAYMENHNEDELGDMHCWHQPSHVPECLLSSLQIFNWSRYFGRPQDRDIAVYILKHGCRLKKATFLADSMQHQVPNLKMIKELTLSSRASSTCELEFVEDDHISI